MQELQLHHLIIILIEKVIHRMKKREMCTKFVKRSSSFNADRMIFVDA
jgi:hypothetical protein